MDSVSLPRRRSEEPRSLASGYLPREEISESRGLCAPPAKAEPDALAGADPRQMQAGKKGQMFRGHGRAGRGVGGDSPSWGVCTEPWMSLTAPL